MSIFRRLLRSRDTPPPKDTLVEHPAGDSDRFELLVEAALAEIPREFRRHLENVAIVIEDEPPAPWLGVYQGSTTRYEGAPWKPPDVIRLYRGPMERRYGHDPELLAAEVRRLVRHEVAHHFGISDARLVELDRY